MDARSGAGAAEAASDAGPALVVPTVAGAAALPEAGFFAVTRMPKERGSLRGFLGAVPPPREPLSPPSRPRPPPPPASSFGADCAPGGEGALSAS